LLLAHSSSKAIGTTHGEIRAYDLGEAMAVPKEFDRKMYDLIGVLSK